MTRILVLKSPRPRRWAGVAVFALLVMAWWSARPPQEARVTETLAAAGAEGRSFVDLAQPTGWAPHGALGFDLHPASAHDGGHAVLPHGADSFAPPLGAGSAQSAQFTGLADNNSVSTPGATPTR